MKQYKNGWDLCPEYEILLYCAHTRIDQRIKNKIIFLINTDLNWEYLLRISAIHRLTPLLYYNLKSICPEKIPNNIFEELKEYFNVNIRKNLLMTGELINIMKLLKSKNITAIPYKGPVLSNLAYGNLSLREFGDIDILVDILDAIKVKNIMIDNGYELYQPIIVKDSYYMKLEPEYQFYNINTGIVIEIKWKIEGNFFSFPKKSNYLFECLEKFELHGFEVNTFSRVDQLLIACIHAAKHDWDRLSWICDISEMLKSIENIDWLEMLDKSEKMNIKRLLFVNIILTRDLFNLELSPDILKQLNSDPSAIKISNQIQERIFKNKNLNIFQKFISDINKRDNLICGFTDCVNGLTRPTYVDFLDISLPESLIFLYFIIRPFLLLKRYGKGSI